MEEQFQINISGSIYTLVQTKVMELKYLVSFEGNTILKIKLKDGSEIIGNILNYDFKPFQMPYDTIVPTTINVNTKVGVVSFISRDFESFENLKRSF